MVRGDSLTGVPFTRPPSCDSCRVAIPLTSVDSVRLGNLEGAGLLVSTVPFMVLFALVIALAAAWGPD